MARRIEEALGRTLEKAQDLEKKDRFIRKPGLIEAFQTAINAISRPTTHTRSHQNTAFVPAKA